jgi:hypothetical protein
MFYSGGSPMLIEIDDNFAVNKNNEHPFVKIQKDEREEISLWPMIVEKAYAKMFGSF